MGGAKNWCRCCCNKLTCQWDFEWLFFRSRQNGLEMRRLFLAGKTIKKVIVVPKKLVNIAVG
jgi:hypothetical protein